MDKEYINSWIEIAIKDLEVSKILYEQKLYSQSFYHFQQAFEKGLKALAFIMKFYTKESDTKNTGHYTLEIFKSFFKEQKENFSNIEKTKTNCNCFDEYNKTLNLDINSMFPNKKEYYEYSSKYLDEILILFKGVDNTKIIFTENFKEQYINYMNYLINYIYQYNPVEAQNLYESVNKILEDDTDWKIFVENIKSHFNYTIKSIPHINVLFFCNLISHNHNNISRYPGIDFNPLKYYNLKRPIIKKLPNFICYLNFSLLNLKKINNQKL